MQKLLRVFAFIVVVTTLALSSACKEQAQQAKKAASQDQSSYPPNPSPSPSPVVEEEEEEEEEEEPGSSSGETDDCKESSDGVFYEGAIKSIISDKCLECHNSGNEDPNLSTYARLKSARSSIVTLIESGDKHPKDGTQLTKSEKTKIKDWVAAGAPERDECGDNSGEVDDSTNDDEWKELISPAKLKECKDAGKIYDRVAEKCHRATVASSYSCTRTGIIDKFKELKVGVSGDMNTMDKDGFVIDQCGEHGGEPIVFFYRKSKESTSDELRLQIRKLCKKGSPACLAE